MVVELCTHVACLHFCRRPRSLGAVGVAAKSSVELWVLLFQDQKSAVVACGLTEGCVAGRVEAGPLAIVHLSFGGVCADVRKTGLAFCISPTPLYARGSVKKTHPCVL